MTRPHYSSPSTAVITSTTGSTKPLHSHATSSAFSSSANPDEDWTKITDLVERRRIQNRIAQRNYRKKQKRRMEYLERRAESTSLSPPQSHLELQDQKHMQDLSIKQCPSSPKTPQHLSPVFLNHNFSISSLEDKSGSSVPDDIIYAPVPNPHPQPYRLYHPSGEHYGDYLTQIPCQIPPVMNFNQNVKRESDALSPYNINFQELTGIGYSGPQIYSDSYSLALPFPESCPGPNY